MLRHPDQPIIGFPSVTYNIVNNTTNIDTAINSTVQQAGEKSAQSSHTTVYPTHDLAKLAGEFSRLRDALLTRAQSAEDYAAIGVIASAELEAKSGKYPKVSALGAAGRWVLDTAREIGAQVVTEIVKSQLGL